MGWGGYVGVAENPEVAQRQACIEFQEICHIYINIRRKNNSSKTVANVPLRALPVKFFKTRLFSVVLINFFKFFLPKITVNLCY